MNPREQPCFGLFGLCIGEPIDVAVEGFGAEAIGYPIVGAEGACDLWHRWQPDSVDQIDICELRGIRNISVWFGDGDTLWISLPGNSMIASDETLADAAIRVSEDLRLQPAFIEAGLFETELIVEMGWFLPTEARDSSDPEEMIYLQGRTIDWPTLELDFCEPESDLMNGAAIEFEKALPLLDEVKVSNLSVETVEPGDFQQLGC